MFKDTTELRAYWKEHGISEDAQRQLEYLRAKSPMRDVGKSALVNVVVHLWSPLMNRHLVCESKTAEALCFMTAELSGNVLEILPQVEMRHVVRMKGKSRHVGTITADALFLTDQGPVFIECKLLSELERLVEERPHEYCRRPDGAFGRPAAEQWALARGATYRLWSPPEPYGLLWANCEFVYPQLKSPPTGDDLRRARAIIAEAESAPLTLKAALQLAPESDLQLIGRLIAHRILHANIKTGLLSHADSVLLSTDAARISEIEAECMRRIRAELDPLDVRSRVNTATSIDLNHGRRRLARVKDMIAGKTRVTKDYRPLVRRVQEAIHAGRCPLEECITEYFKSGNRDLRLDDKVYIALDMVRHEKYEKAGVKNMERLRKALRQEMDLLCCTDPIPSDSTIRRALRLASIDKHNLAFGGKRAFHQHRAMSDPQLRTVNAIAPFTMVHIDSTKFDHRSAAETLPTFEFSCPVLYSCIDVGTGEMLGHSLTFGPPSRFGLAALLRDIVRRHGRLPLTLMADRGSELWSKMILAFAEQYELTLLMRPASAPRFGSQIETALREINAKVAHRLAGSTLPDQKGRSVDPKYKSYQTAKLQFRAVAEVVELFLYDIWLDNPIGSIEGTPRQRKESAEEYYGRIGREVSFNDDFRIATSVPVLDKIKVTPDRAVRCMHREYFNSELRDWIRANGKPDDVRLDPENAELGYAKLGPRWIRLHSRRVLEDLVRDELDRIFERIFTRDAARINRERKAQSKSRTHDLVESANAAQPEPTTEAPPDTASEKSDAKSSEELAMADWAEVDAHIADQSSQQEYSHV